MCNTSPPKQAELEGFWHVGSRNPTPWQREIFPRAPGPFIRRRRDERHTRGGTTVTMVLKAPGATPEQLAKGVRAAQSVLRLRVHGSDNRHLDDCIRVALAGHGRAPAVAAHR